MLKTPIEIKFTVRNTKEIGEVIRLMEEIRENHPNTVFNFRLIVESA